MVRNSAAVQWRLGVSSEECHCGFIDPGKPVQNAYAESFNGRLRDECLNANWFLNVADARRKLRLWRQDYNEARPHSQLDYLPPSEFAARNRELAAMLNGTAGKNWTTPSALTGVGRLWLWPVLVGCRRLRAGWFWIDKQPGNSHPNWYIPRGQVSYVYSTEFRKGFRCDER
jgi:hypothetical protein